MGLEIKKPDDYKILFIGDEQLKQDTAELVETGKAEFLQSDSDEAKALLKDHPELEGDIAIVADKDGNTGETCAISQAGKSLIVHCEDFVLPIKEAGEVEELLTP